MDAHDVRVGHLARHLQLAPEPLQALLGALVLAQQLERDDRVGLEVAHPVHHALGSAPQLVEDLVAVSEDLAALLRQPRTETAGRGGPGRDSAVASDRVSPRPLCSVCSAETASAGASVASGAESRLPSPDAAIRPE